MNERQFQTKFTRWARANLKETTATELKVARGKRFYLKALKPHQKRNLLNTKHNGIYYKIPDVGLAPKPYDGFFIKGNAKVYVLFQETKNVYEIDIDDFVKIETPSVTEKDLEVCAVRISY